jgi:hypothetical protein
MRPSSSLMVWIVIAGVLIVVFGLIPLLNGGGY